MSQPIQKAEIVYTYADYAGWDESERIELIDGAPVMHATPSIVHQEVAGNIFVSLHNFLKGKPCKVYAAPLSVRLEPQDDESDTTVLEPDIFVVCDKSKLEHRGCVGAPDLVIEVLSPSTARNDRIVKFRKYQRAGVREYWIVDPDTRSVHVNTLGKGGYMGAVYEENEAVSVGVLPGCVVELAEVFGQENTETSTKNEESL